MEIENDCWLETVANGNLKQADVRKQTGETLWPLLYGMIEIENSTLQ